MKSTIADPETIVHCIRIVAVDDTTVRFIEYPHNLAMANGQVYAADQGYEFTGITQTDDGAGTLIDLEGILDANGLQLDDIASGKWNGAKWFIFATSWAAPVEDEEPIAKGFLGKTMLFDARYKAELMHLIDALNVPTGRNYTALCSWILFDETLDGKTYPYQRSRCGLTLDDFKVTGTVTGVTDRSQFADTGRAEAADYFGKGSVKFTTGNNAGLNSIKIKTHSAGGGFILHDDAHLDIQVGDEYEMIPGCRKRLTEDCTTKFDNANNFGGFRYLPPSDVITYVGRG